MFEGEGRGLGGLGVILKLTQFQSISVLFYVCSHRGDIRPKNTTTKPNTVCYCALSGHEGLHSTQSRLLLQHC